MAGHDDIDFIHSEDAGRTGRNSLGRQGGLEPLAVLLPISHISERRITPVELAIGIKLNHPSALSDRRFKPHGIFAVFDHRKPSQLGIKAHHGGKLWTDYPDALPRRA